MSQCEAVGSFAGFVDRAGIRRTKTGRASKTLGRKSLIINVQISHPPPKSSGNVRFCTACTGPIRGNPSLRAENPNRNTRVNGTATPLPNRPNRCTVLQRVSPKNFSDLRCNTSTLGLFHAHETQLRLRAKFRPFR